MTHTVPRLLSSSKWTLLLFAFVAFVTACNSSTDKKETTDTTTSVADTALQSSAQDANAAAMAPPANINFPIFKIDRTDLTVPHGKKPSKLIIKFKFANFANPLGSMTLLLYSAKNHAEHAEADDPKEIVDKSEGTKSIARDFIFGNSEVDYKQLLDASGALTFSYLILTPTFFTDSQGRKHLVFNIVSYDDKKQPTKIGTTALTNYDTKPSPPAPPEP